MLWTVRIKPTAVTSATFLPWSFLSLFFILPFFPPLPAVLMQFVR